MVKEADRHSHVLRLAALGCLHRIGACRAWHSDTSGSVPQGTWEAQISILHHPPSTNWSFSYFIGSSFGSRSSGGHLRGWEMAAVEAVVPYCASRCSGLSLSCLGLAFLLLSVWHWATVGARMWSQLSGYESCNLDC